MSTGSFSIGILISSDVARDHLGDEYRLTPSTSLPIGTPIILERDARGIPISADTPERAFLKFITQALTAERRDAMYLAWRHK